MKLALIAVVLGIIALVVSIGQPTYNLLMVKKEEGKPSFCLSTPDFTLFQTFTELAIKNNGTADAHNIKVELVFSFDSGQFPYTIPVATHHADQFIPELARNESTTLYFQIGGYLLNATSLEQVPLSAYKADVYIYCKELGNVPKYFHFDTILSH
jgi:hypothetical protein